MGNQQILESVVAGQIKKDLPAMSVGDTINVHSRIVEGDKERVQVFQGVLISRSGSGINEMITVRRVVDDVGIHRTFPVNSPMVAKYEVLRQGDTRRAKLYYLKDRVGKAQRLRDRRRGINKAEAAAAPGKA